MKRGLFLSVFTFVFATVNANIYYFSSNTGDNSRSHGEIQHMDDIEEVEAKKFYVSLYRSYTG